MEIYTKRNKEPNRTFIVAEIGLNHNGDIKTAKNLIHFANLAGVDACKFQVYWSIPSCKKYNFTKRQWRDLFVLCEGWGMEWFATPFDLEAVKWLDKMEMCRWKLPSNKIVLEDNDLLNEIAKAKNRQSTIISTGISGNKQIKKLIDLFNDKPYALLHCVSKYPTPEHILNLGRIKYLKGIFNCPVGFSDHSTSTTAPLAAVKLGAEIIEKHLTLNRNMEGPDHVASLEPHEFAKMVKNIRNYEADNDLYSNFAN